MAVAQRPGDWVGYPVGIPGAAPATVAFHGFLDFVGFSVGFTAGAPPAHTPTMTLVGVG